MNTHLLLFSIAICFIVGCETKKSKIYKEEYYPSGQIKSKGWYINDSIPVGDYYYFYKNGNPSSIERRDDSGYLNGKVIFFNENGSISGIFSYINNKLNGFCYDYSKTGKLISKLFYLDGKQVGDCDWYSIDGTVKTYNFIDFYGRNLNLIKYGNSDSVIKDLSPIIYIDSIKSGFVDNKADFTNVEIIALLSNPPFRKSQLVVEYLTKNNTVIKKDTVIGKPYYFSKEKFSDTLTTIRLKGIQYDSVTKDTFKQNRVITLLN